MARPKRETIPEDDLLWERFLKARTKYNQHGRQSTISVEKGCGVRHSLIEDAENKDMNPPRAIDYRTVAKLAQYYGVSVGYLAGTETQPRMQQLDEQSLLMLVDSVKTDRVEVHLEFTQDGTTVNIEPWEPYEMKCPYGKTEDKS